MRILLINVPHPAIGSRIPDDHLPPLGLLAVGGPLIDDGHEVRCSTASSARCRSQTWWREAVRIAPDAVLFGHSGSTSGHPVIAEVARGIAAALPGVSHRLRRRVPDLSLARDPRRGALRDAIVRGEGEETARRLMAALEDGADLDAHARHRLARSGTARTRHAPAPVIRDLDAYRVGWELIDHARYSYWGGLRAVVVQFSRGCPHLCNYCGQRGFWTRWRHRDPVALRQGAGAAAPRARRQGHQLRRREPDRLEEGLEGVPRGADRRERRSDPGRLDPRRRHRARCRHPASLQEGRLAAISARHGEHRRGDARADPQGRRRPPPTARRSACCASTASCRWRPGWSASRRRPTATTGAACASSSPTTPTRSRCST